MSQPSLRAVLIPEPKVEIVSGPLLSHEWPGWLEFVVRDGGGPLVTAQGDQDRTYGLALTPGQQSGKLSVVIGVSLRQFSQRHVLLMSRMWLKARALRGGTIVDPYEDGTSKTSITATVVGDVEVHDDGFLLADTDVGGAPFTIRICPRTLDWWGFWAGTGRVAGAPEKLTSHDAVLDYMIHHLPELRAKGLDTTFLEAQMRDARSFPQCDDVPDPDA